MDRTLPIEFSEEEYSEIHREASHRGMSDEEYVKSTLKTKLKLHQRSDEEIGAYLREKHHELYKRLS
ncbi:MAG TPA: hypothetical protein VG537_05375 [Candidatus Kapabacteria bacterium]|nr:hypothetical protein [Candidatus Kapabacteria bacterium]